MKKLDSVFKRNPLKPCPRAGFVYRERRALAEAGAHELPHFFRFIIGPSR
jgi:hypothetical protein